MCSLIWKHVVVVIAVLTLQITYSNGEKGKCTFETKTHDLGNNCCFYEPHCEPDEWCHPTCVWVWKPYNVTVWKTRNFTRPIEECEIGPNKETCTPFKKTICKSHVLPGKCANVTYKKPKTCVPHCPPEFELYNSSKHTEVDPKDCPKNGATNQWSTTATYPIDLRRAGREFIPRPLNIPIKPGTPTGHVVPHGHPGFPAPPGPPTEPQPGPPGPSYPHPPTEPQPGPPGPSYPHPPTPPKPGCHETCEYETHPQCCDFPDKKCEDKWLERCVTEPTWKCIWVHHETCSFYKEDITKYHKIKVKGPEKCVVKEKCTPSWWCKVCEGEDNHQCYKNQDEYNNKSQ